ncbi:N/A [soil metagenome]
MSAPLRILQISTKVTGGGAERVATDLHLGLLERGHEAWLAVGGLNGDITNARQVPIAPPPGAESRVREQLIDALEPVARRSASVRRLQRVIGHPGAVRRRVDRWRGREALEYPGTRAILGMLPTPPDVVHCHNLHGGYFDLRYLPQLASATPLMITLHDEWLMTGHCAYTLGCERWRTGCGDCPDLTIYPAVSRDATAVNRRLKRSVYGKTRFHVSAPSSWLLERAKVSILADGAADFRVIRNGVNRATFNASGRSGARQRLGIPDDAHVLLFAANLTRSNTFKDHETVIAAAQGVGERGHDRRLIMISLGEAGPMVRNDNSELWQLGYEVDPAHVADHYRAADIYLHAANADNAPMTIAEALSCGTPVVATAIGGIPEMIHSLGGIPGAWNGANVPATLATGVLVPPADPEAMAAAASALLTDPAVLGQLSRNALQDSGARFDLDRQLDETVAWYRDAIDDQRQRAQTRGLDFHDG